MQAPFILLHLPGVLEHVKFCVSLLRVESISPDSLGLPKVSTIGLQSRCLGTCLSSAGFLGWKILILVCLWEEVSPRSYSAILTTTSLTDDIFRVLTSRCSLIPDTVCCPLFLRMLWFHLLWWESNLLILIVYFLFGPFSLHSSLI